jgi:predicted Fe-Mo cluster-binding NifX family protein
MKIAISADSPDKEALMDTRFGRAPWFVIWDSESKTYTSLANKQNLEAAQGAGIQSAQNVAETGASAVICGHTGPKAWSLLSRAGIAVYHAKPAPVSEIVQQFEQGLLQKAENSDVEGHWV